MNFRSGLALIVMLILVIAGCSDKTALAPENNNFNNTPITEIPGNETGPNIIDYSMIPIIDQHNPQYWNEHNASEVVRIALRDDRAEQLLKEGGEIVGVLVASHPTASNDRPAIGPALRIRSEEKTVDFIVDEANQSVLSLVIEVHPETCTITRVEDVFRTTRSETIIRGKGAVIEENMTYAVQEFGPDLKLPIYVPDGFFFRYVILPDQYSEGKVTLTFVNKSYRGPFVTWSSANQMEIVFSRNLDVDFAAFAGQEPKVVCIRGTTGFLYNSSGLNKLRWLDGDVERWIAGYFDEITLIRMAESMKYPSEMDLTSDVYSGNKTWPPGTSPPGMTVPATPQP